MEENMSLSESEVGTSASPHGHQAAPDLSHVGSRVSMRLREPSGGYRDILGILERPSAIRRGSGALIEFNPDDIWAWRLVPKVIPKAGTGAPFSMRVQELEQAIEATWPASEITDQAGWRFRSNGGVTNRANSIRPIGLPPYGLTEMELDEAIELALQYYRARALPPVFHISLPHFQDLDTYLEKLNWQITIESHVMVADTEDIPIIELANFDLHIWESPVAAWAQVQGVNLSLEIMARYPSTYVGLAKDGLVVGVGRISQYEDWAIITRLFVLPEYRGQGIGAALMSALVQQIDVKKLALQVTTDNAAAIALYQRLKFRVHHNYRYRAMK